MRVGSRFLATLLAAIVWIYAGLSVAPRSPLAQQAITPAALDATVSVAASILD